MKPRIPEPPTGPTAKAPYATPRLVVYGDLRHVTENSNMTGADGGGGNNSKSM